MKSRISCLAAAGILALASSCSNPTQRVLADVAWSLTCSGTGAGCQANATGQSWDFVTHDGDTAIDSSTMLSLGRVSARCQSNDIGGGGLRVSMRANVGSSMIAIDNLDIAESTGAVLDATCRTTIIDKIGNTFGGSVIGVCSGAAPATGNPCQISNVTVDRNDQDGPSIELRLFCTALPNQSSINSLISVRDSQSPSQPALIRFANCDGL